MFSKYSILVFVILLLSSSMILAQNGIVRGTITDGSSGETMPGVAIVVKGTTKGTTTDLDGKFSLELAPGNYSFEISFISYQTLEMTDIVLAADEVKVFDNIQIQEEGFMLTEVTVSAKEVRNTENSLVAMKRNSVGMLDGISGAGLKKIGDSDAAASMKRVPGVSVAGGKYVYVRGLGDRYTKTVLNGMEIPGLDPDRNTIQMDLFPTNIINNIIVHKTFSAELPADFTGGVVNIETKDFPDTEQGNISVSAGYNPQSHFNSSFLTYDGGKLDFLAIDDGTRAIPATEDIPFFAMVVGDPDGETAQRYKDILTSFNPNLAAYKQSNLMDYSFSANYGNQIASKNDKTIGYNFALSYKYSTDFYDLAEFGKYGLSSNPDEFEMERREYQVGSYGKEDVFINGMAGFAIKTKDAKYRFNIMHLRNGESKAGIFDFYNNDQGAAFNGFQHNLDYSQRSLTNIIIEGTHNYQETGWNLIWKVSPTLSIIKDPDIRFTRYENRDGVFSISTESGFPERIWRDLQEYNVASLINATKETKLFERNAKIGFGASYTFKLRDFIIRNFALNIRGVDLVGDPDEIFAEENLWPMYGNPTSGTTYETPFVPVNPNQFSSNVNNAGVYGSLEFAPINRLKTIVGLRIENYIQRYTGRDQGGQNIMKNDIVLNDIDFFPTINFIYQLTDKQNLRLAASKTIARPSFKELSYAEIYDPITGNTFIGGLFRDANDIAGIEYWDGNLISTDIYNFDIRWEVFPASGQVISVSGFYKSFKNPIEIVQFATQTGSFQPRNVGDGEVLGAEFELRQKLGFISDALKNISISANFTYTQSSIKLSETEYQSRVDNARTGQVVDTHRDMAGQAPYIINGGISYKGSKEGFWNDFDAGLFYNVQGQTLQYVGIVDRPDIYSKPFHSLNFNSSMRVSSKLKIGFKVDNILDSKQESVFVSFNAQDQYYSRLTLGRTFSFKLTYDLF